jgi:hypothetical protein
MYEPISISDEQYEIIPICALKIRTVWDMVRSLQFLDDFLPPLTYPSPVIGREVAVDFSKIPLEHLVTYPLEKITFDTTDCPHNLSTAGVVILTRACFAECIGEPLRSKGGGEPQCRGTGGNSHSRWHNLDDVILPFLLGRGQRDRQSPATIRLIA